MANLHRTSTVAGKIAGLLAVVAGLAGSGWLLVDGVLPYLSVSFSGVHIIDDPAGLGAENAPMVTFWAAATVGLSLLAAHLVYKGDLMALWGLTGVLTILTALGIFTIGLYIAPFAILAFVTAIFLTIGGRKRTAARNRSAT